MRWQLSILTLAMFLISSAANAITFTATTSDPTSGLLPGATITIDVVVVLDAGESINALGSSAYNWDNSVMNFVSGQAVSELFFQNAPQNPDPNAPICVLYPFICQPSGPISNSRGGALVEGTASAGTGFGGVPEVEIIAAINLDDMFGATAFDDPGLDGSPGSVQFQLLFEAAGPGATTLIIGGGSDLDGVSGGDNPGVIINDTVTITVIPEPGTALLMGLGLAGLAAAGRRRA